MATRVQNLIAGNWAGEPEVERRNPADSNDVVTVAASAGATEVSSAVQAALEAQSGWMSLSPSARGTVLIEASNILLTGSDQIARDLVREEGKTLAEAKGEVRRAIDVFRYFGSYGWQATGGVFPSVTPNTMIYTRREPLGVVGLITPWNFPIAIPAWKLGPALISGNAVVLKPAGLTSLTADNLVRSLVDAGLPPGVLNVVHGRGGVVGEALINDPRVQAVSFTGSTDVGLHIHDVLSRRRARVQLEMGGKNALVVLDDADAALAARVAAAGSFGNTGQACTATSRIYCTGGIRKAFLAALAIETDRFQPGDGGDDATLMGPVVSEEQLAIDVESVEAARKDGATIISGAREPVGLFYSPTVLTDIAQDASIVRNEVFGPVVAVLDVDNLDDAIVQVNDSRYGLTAGICTGSLVAAQHFAASVMAGVVKVNRPTSGLDLNVPFGGVKDSSSNTYREQGPQATEFYSWSKTVYLGHDA